VSGSDTAPVRYQRVAGVIDVEVDGERVLLAPASLTYFGLNITGSRLWAFVDEAGVTAAALAAAAAAEYDVPVESIADDVEAFCLAAVDAGVLRAG
jgi:hypothetical protein